MYNYAPNLKLCQTNVCCTNFSDTYEHVTFFLEFYQNFKIVEYFFKTHFSIILNSFKILIYYHSRDSCNMLFLGMSEKHMLDIF